MSKKNQSWTVVGSGKKTFYSVTIAIGGKGPQYGSLSEYSRGKWEFTAKKTKWGGGRHRAASRKLLKVKIMGKGESA